MSKVFSRSTVMICLSIILGVAYFLHYDRQSTAIASGSLMNSAANSSQGQPYVSGGDPVSISLPAVDINLAVINGEEESNGNWTLTSDKAQFATVSHLPNNQTGTTFIYGHYRANVFANLHTITPGELAYVDTADHKEFTYRYEYTYATVPADTSIFTYRGPAILTVQTCSGFFFQNRQMYVFDYVSSKNI